MMLVDLTSLTYPTVQCHLPAARSSTADIYKNFAMSYMGRDLMASLFEMNHCQWPL